jgi:putative transposase
MPETYHALTIHFVFSTAQRTPFLRKEIRPRLWAFMGGIARENKMYPIQIGGVADHVHLLLSMPTSLSPAQAMQRIKGGSSVWLKDRFEGFSQFSWQSGYGAFSVGASQIEATVNYILNQETHHEKRTFQDEYEAFLKRNGVSFEKGGLFSARKD